jgi:hypothetical protein
VLEYYQWKKICVFAVIQEASVTSQFAIALTSGFFSKTVLSGMDNVINSIMQTEVSVMASFEKRLRSGQTIGCYRRIAAIRSGSVCIEPSSEVESNSLNSLTRKMIIPWEQLFLSESHHPFQNRDEDILSPPIEKCG